MENGTVIHITKCTGHIFDPNPSILYEISEFVQIYNELTAKII